MTCGEYELDVDSSLMRNNFVNVAGLDDKPINCKKEVLIQSKLFLFSFLCQELHHTTPFFL